MAIEGSLKKVTVLTGSVGSGKSTAAAAFQELGASLIDADILARQVVRPGTPGHEAIKKEFGDSFFLSDDELDRKKLATHIFHDQDARDRLNHILHPLIREAFVEQLEALTRKDLQGPILYVVPLYFESSTERPEVDRVIVVFSPKELCIERIMARDHCTAELATRMYESQIPMEEKAKQADIVLKNTGTKEELKEQVATVYQTLYPVQS